MCSRLKELGARTRSGTSGMGGTLPRADRSLLRPRLKREGGAARNGQNWYHAGAASSGPDQAQEQARSGGRVRRTTGDGTLRLIEKASSCGQEKGASWSENRGGRADSCPRRRRRDGGNKEVESLTEGKSAGSHD